jgi:predicted GNAT family acetyltransferase
MAKTDQELAQEEINNRQYMYGGTGPFSQFLSGERREILSPESTQVAGFAAGPSGVEYITETIPAQYGPAEHDPSYSPVRRGLSALGDMLSEAPSFLGFRGPDEQAEAIQGVGSSLRDALFGTSEYMSEQARAAASGGEYFDPETGRIVAFDPTIVMGGGSSGGGPALASGFRRSGGRQLPATESAKMLDEVDNLSSPKSFSAWDITSDPVEVFDEFGELTNVVDGPEYALIEKIYVDPSERGQGAARNLLRESIAEIQEKHPQLAIKLAASQLEKGTDLDQLVSFYENEGFISLPVEPGMDFIPMEYRGGKIDDLDLYSGGGRQGTAIAAGSALRGLDMDQGARMQRAQDLGFDTNRVAYRGLRGEYDPNKAGNYQMFTSSPEDAGEYGSNVVSSYLRKGNNLVVDGGRNNFNSIPVRNLPDAVRANLHSSVGSVARTDDIAYAAQAAGYDSVSINNVFDKASNEIPLKPPPASNAPMSQEMMDLLDEVDASGMLNNTPNVALPPEIPRNYDPTTIDIIFDPKNIRSIEAEFDPTKADSADLLSSRQSERQMSALRGIA